HEDDDDIQQTLVPVYEHQRSCWNALLSDIEANRVGEDKTLEELREEYFFDCDVPRPASHQIDAVVTATRRVGSRPEFQELEGRKECDPMGIAQEIWERQFGPLQIDQLLTSKYSLPLTKAIFPSYEEFRDIVQKEVNSITLEKTGRRPTLGT
ncbi:MAG: hypothetical protein ACK55I_05415, partial [bacterium]